MDPILHCSNLHNKANAFDHTAPMKGAAQGGPTRSSRSAAMVHLAMHDAFFGVAGLGVGGLGAAAPASLYLGTAAPAAYGGPGGAASESSAIGEAARIVLTHLYREQAAMFDEGINALNAVNGSTPEGMAYGRAVGNAILALRGSDGAAQSEGGYVYGFAKPYHRSDPINAGQDSLGANWGKVRPFAVDAFLPLAAPPSYAPAGVNHPLYIDQLKEVAVKGGAASQKATTRTVDETVIGLYWAYDGAVRLGTPPRLYNQILAQIAMEKGNSLAQNARLFGLVNAAMGDAGIHAWHYKYGYDLWRPVVGIREHDANFGPDAKGGQLASAPCDPFWRPFGAPKTNDTAAGARSFTPPFPAYPSGHATFGAAVFEMVRLFYGHADPKTKDTIGFTFVSDELDGRSIDNDGTVRTRHVRKFTSVADAMYENSVSRIFLGVHWRFDGTTGGNITDMLKATDNIGGVPLGRAIAQNIFGTKLAQSPTGLTGPAVPPAT